MQKIIVGNWKMNMKPTPTKDFFEELIPRVKDSKNKIILLVPFTELELAKKLTKGTNILIGAQNMHYEIREFTGEISPYMLYNLGVDYVLIGHSDRRMYFHEDNEEVNLKIKAALEYGITPILCVGNADVANIRRDRRYNEIYMQITEALKNIDSARIQNLIIVYEPAEGVEKLGYSEIEMIGSYIKDIIKRKYNFNVPVLYSGYMPREKQSDVLNIYNIDGGLFDKESLFFDEFARICNI